MPCSLQVQGMGGLCKINLLFSILLIINPGKLEKQKIILLGYFARQVSGDLREDHQNRYTNQYRNQKFG